MSVSLYYEAKRAKPLSAAEQNAIAALVAEYDAAMKQRWGSAVQCESFCVYPRPDTASDVIFEGATKLPNGEDAMWDLLQHWVALLSHIRPGVPGAKWHVHVDDHELVWDTSANEYDPSL